MGHSRVEGLPRTRLACAPVNDVGRIVELSVRTTDEVLRWHREPDGSLSSWFDDGQAVLSRSEVGRIRLALGAGTTLRILESNEADLTGDLVALWETADAHADPD